MSRRGRIVLLDGRSWASYAALTGATLAAAVAFADAGYDVVVDTVFERAECATSLLEARERARGDRPVGQARGQADRVLHGAPYELVVDTTTASPNDAVALIAALLRR